jgi:hypothetical protein
MRFSKSSGTFAAALVAVVLAASAAFAGETPITAKGTLVDVMCSADIKTQADADNHTRECALMDSCVKSGYGIVIDGKFHKFDAEGSKQAEAIVRSTKKEDHITATVVGTTLDDGSIRVKTLTAE